MENVFSGNSGEGCFDYQQAAEDLRAESGAKYVVFNELIRGEKLLETRAIAGGSEQIRKAAGFLGLDLVGSKWEPDELVERVINMPSLSYLGTLPDVSMNQIPAPLGLAVSRMFGVDAVYGMGLQTGGEKLGFFLFFLKKGEELRNASQLDRIIRYIGIALKAVRERNALPAGDVLGDIRVESEREEIEEALVPEILYQLDDQSRVVFLSRAITRYGYQPEELIGRSVFEIIHPEDRERAQWRINERRTGERRTFQFELRLLPKDREPIRFSVYGYQLEIDPVIVIDARGLYREDEAGKKTFQGTVGVARDMTQVRALEKQLSEQKIISDTIAEAIQEAIWVEESGPKRILYVNKAFENMFGNSEAWLSVVHPEDREKMRKRSEDPASTEEFREYRILSGDSVRWIRSILFPVRVDAEGTPNRFVGLAEDITSLKERENELKQSLEVKTLLMREIYHRVKNNLMIIDSIISLELADMPDKDMSARSVLQSVQSRIATMGIIHQMLFRDSGHSDARQGELDIREYLDYLLDYLLRSLTEDPGRIRVHSQVDTIMLDSDQAVPLGLIVTELIINALKYGFPEGRSGRLELHFQEIGEEYHLIVWNDGPQYGKTGTNQNGVHLGFQLIETLTEQLDGRCIFPEEGGDARFEIVIPRRSD
ncbi:MAG: PAS domain S-box protein [Spirochaetales bacterium]|nr:PAS domain S-box protein [Spirochaetales bacterium]MCF7937015.1 PAS domain S-box protein [Spirochaetales bacterium]